MGERKKLLSIVIDNFSEYVKKSDKTREIPYIKGKCRLPKMYDNDEYEWRRVKFWGKDLEVLYRKSDGLRMVANKKSANKPKFVKVNGQDLYNQRNNSFVRAVNSQAMHTYYKQYLKGIEPFKNIDDYPLIVEFLFYIYDEGKHTIDNDNRWIWEKGFQDTLTELGIIPDDNCNVICRNEKETILIPVDQEQKLVINIYKKDG